MQKSLLTRALTFVGMSVVSGLALAFLIVAWRPELVRRAATDAVATASSAPSPVREGAVDRPERDSYADAVGRAAPAVVNIFTQRLVTEQIGPPGFDQLFGGSFFHGYRQRVERSLGSGVIVDEQGHIVTNQHVIANAEEIRVQLADGRTADATIVGRDPDTDLAVLKISLKHLPVMTLGQSDQLRVGDVVLAIGDPLGLSQTVTHGIVSATGRQQLAGGPTFEDFIQTDAPINVGNSGGALVDTDGDLVGINTAMAAQNLGFQGVVEGIGFAIPVNLVRGVVSEIIAKGRVIRGWIGILAQDVTAEEAAQLGLVHGGVVIAALYRGSPAAQAGLKPGDLIATIDGRRAGTSQDVMAHVASLVPGDVVRIQGVRGTGAFDVRIRTIEDPRNR